MDTLIIFSAQYLIFVLVVAAAVLIYMSGRRKQLALTLIVALPLAYALARIAGLLFAHEQPFAAEGFEPLIPHEIDNSFPSDHVALAGVFASVGFLAHRYAGLVLGALTLLIGASRMAAGLHYSVDVVMGVAIALLATALAAWAVSLFFQRE
jgi:undecaprenyl-diphosphatase